MYTMLCGVAGIQNKECKTQIKNALNKIEGVNAVGVDLTSSTIEIQYNDPATENELKNCIEKTGFKIQYE